MSVVALTALSAGLLHEAPGWWALEPGPLLMLLLIVAAFYRLRGRPTLTTGQRTDG